MLDHVLVLSSTGKRHLALIFSLAAGLIFNTGAAPAAEGTTIVVTTTTDELATDGNCSLREAIRSANLNLSVDACPAGSGADTIRLPAGTYKLSIGGSGEDTAATGDLDITANLNILGDNAATTIIDGNALDRVIEIESLGMVQIGNVTIRNGFAPESEGGGGVLNNGTLLMMDSVVTANTTRTGGGIDNAGTLGLIGSTVSNNAAFDKGGGIHNTGVLSMTNSIVAGNMAGRGGGINTTGTMTVTASTLSGNTAERGGGMNNAGHTTIDNSTVSGNTAGRGGGIDNTDALSVTSSTISANIASQAGGVFNAGSVFSMGNTILAGNTAGDGLMLDCGGKVISQGYNLIQNVGSCDISGDVTSNLVGLEPKLGPLQRNGGSTPTHALLPGSPAIDAGNPASPGGEALACPFIDQRGEQRPQDGNGDGMAACDIGAYELLPAAPPCSLNTPHQATVLKRSSPAALARVESLQL